MPYNEKAYDEVLLNTFEKNENMKVYGVSLVGLVSNAKEKYVGCVYCKNKLGEEICVNINNSASQTMLYYPESRRIEYVGALSGLKFSYTCGGYYNKDNCVYGFPRNSKKLLKIDINDNAVAEINIGLENIVLEDKNVRYGHHYGGVLLGDRIISPPRIESNYILEINLKTYTHRKVYDAVFDSNRYNGAVLHPNGNIYFTPMGGSTVAEFNPQTDEVKLIGNRIPVNLFCGTVYADSCIYSFAQGVGLYRIDVVNNRTELVADKSGNTVIGGCYGTITHYNGKIYGIPGNTSHFYEYDPRTDKCRIYCTFDDGRFNNAKWAGGQLLTNGNIYLVPAFGRFAAEIMFDSKPVVSDEMRELIYSGYFSGM